MTVFVSLAAHAMPQWNSAFPDAYVSYGLPKQFDTFDRSIIFVNTMGLTPEQKSEWLSCAVATKRKVIVLSSVPDDDEAIAVIQQGAVGYGHALSVPDRLREMALVVKHGGLWVGNSLLKRILGSIRQVSNSSAERPFSVEPKADLASQSRLAESQSPHEIESIRALASASDEGMMANASDEPQQSQRAEAQVFFQGRLSEREFMVAKLVAVGATNQEIAQRLDIKERTVKAHITATFEKLHIRNRVELALLLNNVQVPQDPMDNSSKQHAL
ncbi:MAG: two-component system nitrate/nitrite response regulator NarL [Lentisphaeria bacterium]|jgi:two-component system nitrate/nitrite response regulator NarL